MNKKQLIEFTEDIKKIYETGKIHAPIHLSGHGEEELIKIFKNIKRTDWVFGTWRSHYLWLLSGRSPKELKKQIVDGHSMHIYGDKFFTSAIVGGIAPIAVGIAWGIKKNNSKDHVWCFLGDGGVACGISRESITYSEGHDLPITFVIQNNGLQVNAVTEDTWGKGSKSKVIIYNYKRKYNHAGHGLNGEKKYVMF